MKFLNTDPQLDYQTSDDSMFLIWDDLVDPSLLDGFRDQAIQLAAEGKLRDAGFGKDKATDKKVRNDQLMWLTDATEDSPLAGLVQEHRALKEKINANSGYKLDG